MYKKISLLLLTLIIIFSFSGCQDFTNSEKKEADFSEAKAICELATLKCYYHNTCELKQESTGLGKYFGNKGYKKAWIEYDGIVKLGIDASKMKIEADGNIVKVYVPDAKILSIDIDVDSISEKISETGWFTKITTEDRSEAQESAQENMEEKAESNTALLEQATQRAKDTIENYILNVGNLIGVEYEIQWMAENDA